MTTVSGRLSLAGRGVVGRLCTCVRRLMCSGVRDTIHGESLCSVAVSSTINLNDAAAVIDVFQRAAAAMRDSPRRSGSAIRLPARGAEYFDSPRLVIR